MKNECPRYMSYSKPVNLFHQCTKLEMMNISFCDYAAFQLREGSPAKCYTSRAYTDSASHGSDFLMEVTTTTHAKVCKRETSGFMLVVTLSSSSHFRPHAESQEADNEVRQDGRMQA
jgi:hypothetical protein